MNRVLSWPQTTLFPGLLEPLKKGRTATRIDEHGGVRIELPLGPVEMRLMEGEAPLPAGTRVYVWWKGGGFVCAPVAELRAEAHHARAIERQVHAARERLEVARRERLERESGLSDFDVLPPPAPRTPDTPLLQRR